MQCIQVSIEIQKSITIAAIYMYLSDGMHRHAHKNNVNRQLIKHKMLRMSRIEPVQGNQKLLRVDIPALPVELARLKLLMLAKEA